MVDPSTSRRREVEETGSERRVHEPPRYAKTRIRTTARRQEILDLIQLDTSTARLDLNALPATTYDIAIGAVHDDATRPVEAFSWDEGGGKGEFLVCPDGRSIHEGIERRLEYSGEDGQRRR